MVNMLREHVPQETRIHYVITAGGSAPNVIPDFAEVYYYVRNPDPKNVVSIFERVVNAAEGAALGTDTRMEYEVIHGIYALLPNEVLAQVMNQSLERVGGVSYTPEEMQFGEVLQRSLIGDVPPLVIGGRARRVLRHRRRQRRLHRCRRRQLGGTDRGDARGHVGARERPAHSWQAIAAGGTTIGNKGMVVAAKTLTLTAIELFEKP